MWTLLQKKGKHRATRWPASPSRVPRDGMTIIWYWHRTRSYSDRVHHEIEPCCDVVCGWNTRRGGIAKREGLHGKKKKQRRYKSQFETLDAEMLRLKRPVGWYLRKLVTRQPMGRPSGDAKSHPRCFRRWGVFRKCTFCYSLGNRFYLHLSSNVGP